jgi:hypothetical protein
MADVQSAWIAAGASLAVSFISLGSAVWANFRSSRMQREQAATAAELEKLKSRLSADNDAAKAKRDYEYDARKRLYAELYPLAFQLHEAALGAQHRIINLALATRGGWLAAGPDNWLTGADPYYFTSAVHSLIAPLAIVELMTRKLTMLDLTLDQSLRRQHFIARKAYEALRSDFNLVDRRFPPLTFGPGDPSYAPPEVRPATLPPEVEQRWKWRQGLYSGQISQAVDAVLILDGTVTRAMTYAEFAKALAGADLRATADPGGKPGEMKRALQPLTDVLRDFHPARRPVTWRILLAQGACYRAIAAAAQSESAAPEAVLRAALYADAKDLPAFDWIGDGMRSIPPALCSTTDFAAEQQSAFAAADLYIKGVFEDFSKRYKASA